MGATVPTWAELYGRLPREFRPYALGLAWDRERLWALDLPVENMHVAELEWQLSLPWWRDADRYFSLRPLDVLRSPSSHPEHFARTLRADLSYPLDLILRSDRWFVLDGVHRLLYAWMLGAETVSVRKLQAEALPLIAA